MPSCTRHQVTASPLEQEPAAGSSEDLLILHILASSAEEILRVQDLIQVQIAGSGERGELVRQIREPGLQLGQKLRQQRLGVKVYKGAAQLLRQCRRVRGMRPEGIVHSGKSNAYSAPIRVNETEVSSCCTKET